MDRYAERKMEISDILDDLKEYVEADIWWQVSEKGRELAFLAEQIGADASKDR